MTSKTIMIAILIPMLLLIVACEDIDISQLSEYDLAKIEKQLIRCDSPYIRHAADCCLDQNSNKICDEDEGISMDKDPTPKDLDPSDQSEKWNTCDSDDDCSYLPHPCCPGWTSIIGNKDNVRGIDENSDECTPTPTACYSAAPAMLQKPLECRNSRCVIKTKITEPKDPSKTLSVSEVNAFPNDYRGTKIKVHGKIDVELSGLLEMQCFPTGEGCDDEQLAFMIIRSLDTDVGVSLLNVYQRNGDGYERFQCEILNDGYYCHDFTYGEEATINGVLVKTQTAKQMIGSSIVQWRDQFFLVIGDTNELCTNNYCELNEVESCPQDCASYGKVSCDNEFSCPQPIGVSYRCHNNQCIKEGKVPTCGNGICEEGEKSECFCLPEDGPECSAPCTEGTCPQDCETESKTIQENPYFCQTDEDCEVKDVHNCCGYYPRCVNKDYIPDIEAVKRKCAESDAASICGYSEIERCECIENSCKSMQGDKIV